MKRHGPGDLSRVLAPEPAPLPPLLRADELPGLNPLEALPGALAVRCPAPWCKASAGVPCETADGRHRRRPHAERERAAAAKGGA